MTGFLRDADWLDEQRVRGYAWLLIVAWLALFVASYRAALGPAGTDFLAFWGAGSVTAAGDPAAAYDLTVQKQVQTATGSEGWFAFVNPPPFLFVVAPLGLLAMPVAWLVWTVATWGLWAWAAWRAFPRYGILILAYPGALIAAGHGQTGLFTGALLVLAAHWIGRRPALSGMAIGALIVKPHLAVLAPVWFAAARFWRAFLAAGATVAALLAASWLVFGTQTLLAYTTSWDASARLMETADADFLLRMTTFYSQARLHFGEGPAIILAAASLLAALLAVWRAPARFGGDPRAGAAVALAATALASPYLFSYDLPFLIFPTLWLVETGRRHGFRAYEKLGLVALYFAPYVCRAAAFPLQINLTPIAAAILLFMVWSRGSSHPGHVSGTKTEV